MIEVERAPVETVTPIKPSEAIRLGCLLAPRWIQGNLFGPHGGACAIGALMLGAGFGPGDEDENYTVVARLLAGSPPEACPVCGQISWFDDGITDTVIHLNDTEQWSRERIADWLESLGL